MAIFDPAIFDGNIFDVPVVGAGVSPAARRGRIRPTPALPLDVLQLIHDYLEIKVNQYDF